VKRGLHNFTYIDNYILQEKMPAVNTMLLLFSTKNTENLPKFFRPQYVVFSER